MMKKDFSKQRAVQNKSRLSIWFIIFLFILLSFAAGLYVYKSQKPATAYAFLNNYIVRSNAWVAAHKSMFQKVQGSIDKVKQLASDEESDAHVHFEFYSALPDMQMEAAQEQKGMANETAKQIISADDIEKELTDELSQAGYIVQLGVFKSQHSAEQLQQSVSRHGLTATVIKTMVTNKEFYRVQIGPYTNKDEAQVTMRKLQQQGMNGLIRKFVS